MMTYDSIKNIPTTRDGKMIYGILAAVAARLFVNKGFETIPENAGDALMSFMLAGVLVFVTVLAIVRYDSGRPLFESLPKAR